MAHEPQASSSTTALSRPTIHESSYLIMFDLAFLSEYEFIWNQATDHIYIYIYSTPSSVAAPNAIIHYTFWIRSSKPACTSFDMEFPLGFAKEQAPGFRLLVHCIFSFFLCTRSSLIVSCFLFGFKILIMHTGPHLFLRCKRSSRQISFFHFFISSPS